jgi:hypothetical protein
MKIVSSLWSLLNMALLFFSQPLFADAPDIEYRIKAGYLYNFTKFISWPADTARVFNLCIRGKDPFGDLINPIEKKYALGRSIRVLRLGEQEKGEQCHILYTGSSESSSNNTSIHVGKTKTLTVGENNEFATQGGMIGFVNRDGKIKLQINLEAIRQGGLTVSAKLLEVAEIIQSSDHD